MSYQLLNFLSLDFLATEVEKRKSQLHTQTQSSDVALKKKYMHKVQKFRFQSDIIEVVFADVSRLGLLFIPVS